MSGNPFHYGPSITYPVPPMASILYLHTLPTLGGDTCFGSMYAAYDALSEKMKSYLDGLTATHDGRIAFGRFNPTKTCSDLGPPGDPAPSGHRPQADLRQSRLYLAHQRAAAGRECEGARLPLRPLESPLWQCRFTWRKHSIAFWDNRCTQHYAVWDYRPQVRSGWRVQIANTQPPRA